VKCLSVSVRIFCSGRRARACDTCSAWSTTPREGANPRALRAESRECAGAVFVATGNVGLPDDSAEWHPSARRIASTGAGVQCHADALLRGRASLTRPSLVMKGPRFESGRRLFTDLQSWARSTTSSSSMKTRYGRAEASCTADARGHSWARSRWKLSSSSVHAVGRECLLVPELTYPFCTRHPQTDLSREDDGWRQSRHRKDLVVHRAEAFA
jgi:hypothetical protein